MLIDFLRLCRKILCTAGHAQVFGFHIDFLLHFLAASILAFVLRRWLSVSKTGFLIIVLMTSKEIIDIFVKSRFEYIRPPGLDFTLDVLGGVTGLCLGLVLSARFSFKRHTKND